jgi:vancomycin resistance protein YoaR
MSGDVRIDSGPRLRQASAFLSLCGVGALTGLLLVPEPVASAAKPVPVLLSGQPVAPSLGATALLDRYLGGTIELRSGALRRVVRRAELGVAVDAAHLSALLEAAADARSPLRRLHERASAGRPLSLRMPVAIDPTKTTEILMDLRDAIERAPIDAHVDPRKRRAVPAQPGVVLDVFGSLERIEAALAEGAAQVELATHAIPARGHLAQLASVDMGQTLADFTTRYARGPDALDRIHNLRVAAAKVDGFVLAPGAVFDFNAVVGDRTAHNGFRPAKVIADGDLVDGVGGGTCQIASTLHAAVFFAGLPVLTRSPHSHPSYYIKLGLDAAVAYGSLNFRFQNDRPFPVVLEATVEDGFVRAAVHGKERSRTVTFLRRVDSTKPFDEKIVEDETLPSSMRVLQQRGIPGFEITTFRVVVDEQTRVARRERGTDKYPPTTQIWRVGTGGEPGPDFVPPKSDTHPEYVADEFMTATEGPGIDGIQVTATAGRTGAFGWTEREGLRKPSSLVTAQVVPE